MAKPPLRPDHIALAISALAAAVTIACAVARAITDARAERQPAPVALDSQ